MDVRGISPTLKLAGVGAVAGVGLVHLIEAPEYYGEVHYIGILFVLSAITAAVSCLAIWKDNHYGWVLGAILAGSNLVAYTLSRTVGLPQFRENPWSSFTEPMGLISMAVEIAALVICIRVLRGGPTN